APGDRAVGDRTLVRDASARAGRVLRCRSGVAERREVPVRERRATAGGEPRGDRAYQHVRTRARDQLRAPRRPPAQGVVLADQPAAGILTPEVFMCRNIKTLYNFDPPATDAEIRNASIQFVRKLTGFHKPSRANETAFDLAVDEVSVAA